MTLKFGVERASWHALRHDLVFKFRPCILFDLVKGYCITFIVIHVCCHLPLPKHILFCPIILDVNNELIKEQHFPSRYLKLLSESVLFCFHRLVLFYFFLCVLAMCKLFEMSDS